MNLIDLTVIFKQRYPLYW